MLHTAIIPRLPFVVRPVVGIPGPPLQPIVVHLEGDGLAHAWTTCYAHLLALHALYARLGVRRPLGRLHDLTTAMHPVIWQISGVAVTRSALAAAHAAVESLDDESSILGYGLEAGWWVVALQASLALGVWYELAPGASQAEADYASHVATSIRRILGSVFEPKVASAIQESSHGDGSGDLLAQVAANAMSLGAPLQGMPEVGASA
jgi:hypothetical protein